MKVLRRVTRTHPLFYCLLWISLLFTTQPAGAAPFETVSTPRFTLYIQQSLREETRFVNAADITSQSLTLLDQNYEELSRIFNARPTNRVVLRFLSPSEFHRHTGAPGWTSAMYFRGEISIPVDTDKPMSFQQLSRALRHEYVHAVVAELSGGKCPAWMDEGLAQIIEGKPNTILGPALRAWLTNDDPLPLNWLDGGFTTLNDDLVPVAYAQSFFATKSLINQKGFVAISKYLQLLRAGSPPENGFQAAFGVSLRSFEADVSQQLVRWWESDLREP